MAVRTELKTGRSLIRNRIFDMTFTYHIRQSNLVQVVNCLSRSVFVVSVIATLYRFYWTGKPSL